MPVISSKAYIAGDVVFKCKPLYVCILKTFKGKHCDNCLKLTDQLKRCSKCLQMYYCGRNCQSIDWSFHKNECKVFRGKTINEFDTFFMPLLRLYLRIKNDKTFATERHTLFDGSDVSLNDIKNKITVKCIQEEMRFIFNMICHELKRLSIDFEAKELFQWYEFMCQNTYNFFHNSDNPMDFDELSGSSMCLQMWPISHSCFPNTAFLFKDGLLEIRAMKSIAIGEEITMSWVPLYINRDNRRRQLNRSLMVCNCDKCKLHLDKDIDYQEFEQILAIHANHWISFKSEIFPNINFTYEMDSNLMIYFEAMYGEYNPAITDYLLKSFICFTNSMKASDSLLRLWFKRIERHVLVTHGSDHPWYAMLRNIFDKSLKI